MNTLAQYVDKEHPTDRLLYTERNKEMNKLCRSQLSPSLKTIQPEPTLSIFLQPYLVNSEPNRSDPVFWVYVLFCIAMAASSDIQSSGGQPIPPPQVPPGSSIRPQMASAGRGTNVAVSKRTRFALQVQKPTGEEGQGSKESTVSGMDLGLVPSPLAGQGGLPSPRGARGARRSRSPGARGGRGGQPPGPNGGPPIEGGGRGARGGGRGRAQAVRGAPSLSTDDDSGVNLLHEKFIHRGKSR